MSERDFQREVDFVLRMILNQRTISEQREEDKIRPIIDALLADHGEPLKMIEA